MEASKGKRKEEISRIDSRGRISLVHNKGSAVKGDTGQKLQSRREHASSVYAMVASPEEKNPEKKRSVISRYSSKEPDSKKTKKILQITEAPRIQKNMR